MFIYFAEKNEEKNNKVASNVIIIKPGSECPEIVLDSPITADIERWEDFQEQLIELERVLKKQLTEKKKSLILETDENWKELKKYRFKAAENDEEVISIKEAFVRSRDAMNAVLEKEFADR